MYAMTSLDPSDLVLLILGAPSGDPDQADRCAGITRLEKLAFLVENSAFSKYSETPAEPLQFQPYHYGPYTRELYDAIDLLTGIDLVREQRAKTDTSLDVAEELRALEGSELGAGSADPSRPYEERVFELTEKGRYVAQVIAKRVGERAVNEVSRIKDEYGSLPLRQLLRTVYRQYPEMASKSRIREAI